MVDMFVNKMCYYCSNDKCKRKITIYNSNGCYVYKCCEYIKDKSKIVPYQEPLVVTAERDYVNRKQL